MSERRNRVELVGWMLTKWQKQERMDRRIQTDFGTLWVKASFSNLVE